MSVQLEDLQVMTPLGEFHMLMHQTDGKDVVYASGFGSAVELRQRLQTSLGPVTVHHGRNSHIFIDRVRAYFEGEATALEVIPTTQPGSPFFLQVWQAMRSIPVGKTRTYAELAEAAGKPTAIRAAGTACGRNKLILLVPCHRIIRTDSGLGGYVYGPRIKQALLAHEAQMALVRKG